MFQPDLQAITHNQHHKGEGNVGGAGVLTGEAPGRFSMTDEQRLGWGLGCHRLAMSWIILALMDREFTDLAVARGSLSPNTAAPTT